MNYYDVLLSACWVGTDNESWYFVSTIKAGSNSAAVAKAKRRLRSFFARENREVLYINHHGSGPAGCYSQFVGKRVGQLIDEALGER